VFAPELSADKRFISSSSVRTASERGAGEAVAIMIKQWEFAMEDNPKPIHHLQDILQAARRQEIIRLSENPAEVTNGSLQPLAFLQLALTAVRDEIVANEKHLGGGNEVPLS
jgi:hypothetical protein